VQKLSTARAVDRTQSASRSKPKQEALVLVTAAPKVYSYLDYREFLLAYYEHRKKISKGFSYRVFSRMAGMNTLTYMKRIIDGERSLSEMQISPVATACRLSEEESRYFAALVRWNQATSDSERSMLWDKVLEAASKDHLSEFDQPHLRVITKWYILAVLEMIQLKDFKPDADWIAKRFRWKLTSAEIQEAVTALKGAGLVTESGGRFTATHKVLLKKKNLPCDLTRMLHMDLLRRILESIDQMRFDERHISSSMLCIKKENIPKLKEEIRKFQIRILQTLSADGDGDDVVQLFTAIFPMTK
jgi:uncharacterized protein (TIGR02147 family)